MTEHVTEQTKDLFTRTCPYCGEEEELILHDDSSFVWLECNSCMFSAPNSYDGTDLGAYVTFDQMCSNILNGTGQK